MGKGAEGEEMSMREEFEAAMLEQFEIDLEPFRKVDDTGFDGYCLDDCFTSERSQLATCAWMMWQAAIKEVQPEWHPMSELPPFPFRGDIYCKGKIIINADWAGGGKDNGYWQSPKGDRSIDLVSHWKPSNKPISPPDGVAP